MLKDIKGFEGYYAVSEDGKVWSYRSNKFLKPSDNGHGYLMVQFFKDNKKTRHRIHRLVLETFNPVGGMENLQVNHIDEDKHNNCLSNLEWCTPSENVKYSAYKRKHRRRCAVGQYNTDGELIAVYPSQAEAARQLGICKQSIVNVLRGRQKTGGGFLWRYEDGVQEV